MALPPMAVGFLAEFFRTVFCELGEALRRRRERRERERAAREAAKEQAEWEAAAKKEAAAKRKGIEKQRQIYKECLDLMKNREEIQAKPEKLEPNPYD